MTQPIEVSRLVKTFGDVHALDGLNLIVPAGAVYGLIGRNGAGKTTALRCLMGLLRPTSGQAHVLGLDMWSAPGFIKSRVAYVSQTQQLHHWMTLEELGYYLSHFYEAWSDEEAGRLAKVFDLPAQRPIGQMSGGQQRAAAIVLALATRPEVLILDEPAAALDPIARRRLVEQLVRFVDEGQGTSGGQRTILFSTHILSDLERIADHVGLMDHGKLLTQGRLEDLRCRTRRVQVVFDGDGPPPGFAIPGAQRVRVEGPVLTAVVRADDESEFDQLMLTPAARVQLFPLGLEELFIELLGPQAGAELQESEVA